MRESKLLIFFTNSTCWECKQGANEISKLAQHVIQEDIKLARADCSFDLEPCDLMVNHLESSNGTYPLLMMLTEFRSYIYSGPLNADDIYNTFVKDKKYIGFKYHGKEKGDYTFRRMMDDGRDYVMRK